MKQVHTPGSCEASSHLLRSAIGGVVSVTIEQSALFALFRVTLRLGETSDAAPHTEGTGRGVKHDFLSTRTLTRAIADPGICLGLCVRIPNPLNPVWRMVKNLS